MAPCFLPDPPYGLPLQDSDPEKDIPFNGVYKMKDGTVEAIIKDLTRPNGIAFSPDEKTLYVSNSDDKRRIWMRYDIGASGTVSNGRVFFDTTNHEDGGLPDGMKLDVRGNLWATGPSAVFVFSPEGTHLGTIKPPEDPGELWMGRRRPDVVHHGGDRSLPNQDVRHGTETGVS